MIPYQNYIQRDRNFCAAFLSEQCAFEENGMPRQDSSVCVGRLADMVRHVQHIASVGGVEVCGLGTDFDGIGNSVEFGDASGMESGIPGDP